MSVGEEGRLRQQLTDAIASHVTFIERIRQEVFDTSDGGESLVYEVAAALNDEGAPVIELLTCNVASGMSHEDANMVLFPVIERCRRIDSAGLLKLMRAIQGNRACPLYQAHQMLMVSFERAPSIGEACIADALGEEPTDSELLKILAAALAVACQAESIFYFIDLWNRGTSETMLTALHGLCSIDTGALSSDIEKTEKLAEISATARRIDETRSGGYVLLCHLVATRADLWEALLTEIKGGVFDAQREAAHWLRMSVRNPPAYDVARLAVELTDAAMRNPDLCRWVDEMISTWYHLRGRPEVVTSALEVIGKEFVGRFEEKFPRVFSLLTKKPDVFASAVSHWLLSAQYSTDALSAVLTIAPVTPSVIAVDQSAFANASPKDRRRAIRRLMGQCYNGAAIASFLMQLAVDPINSNWAEHAFLDVADGFLRQEYPGETRDFLQASLSNLKTGELLRAVQQILKLIADWEDVLRSLPNLPELTPGPEKRLSLSMVRRRQHEETRRGAHEKSVLTDMFTQIHVKQGRRVISRMPDGQTHISEMRPLTVQFELPNSEVLDPLQGQINRMVFLRDEE